MPPCLSGSLLQAFETHTLQSVTQIGEHVCSKERQGCLLGDGGTACLQWRQAADGSSAEMTKHSYWVCQLCKVSARNLKRAPNSQNSSANLQIQVHFRSGVLLQSQHGSCITSQQGQHAVACPHCSAGAGSSQPELRAEGAICASACARAIRCHSRSPASAGAHRYPPCNRAGELLRGPPLLPGCLSARTECSAWLDVQIVSLS